MTGFEEEITLDYLVYHWGDAYELSYSHRTYRAHRRDDGAELSAGTPGGLLKLIQTDYQARPVPRDAP